MARYSIMVWPPDLLSEIEPLPFIVLVTTTPDLDALGRSYAKPTARWFYLPSAAEPGETPLKEVTEETFREDVD